MNKQLIHAFSVDVANQIGLERAIVLHQFSYWVSNNEANARNFYDGKYWTYNSFNALQQLFPYWSISTIKRIVASLVKSGFLIQSHNAKNWSDRTNWYTVSTWPNGSVQVDTVSSVQVDTVSSVQVDPMYINKVTQSNTNSETTVLETKYSSIIKESCFDTVYANYPRKMGRKAAFRHFLSSVKTQQDLVDIATALDNYNDYLIKNKIEMQFTQMASTWFNNWRDWTIKVAEPKKVTGASGREL